MLVFDHIGLVVPELEAGAQSLLQQLPIVARSQRFDDSGLGVSVVFLREASGLLHELIAPLGNASPVENLSRSTSSRISQFAYVTDDIAAEANKLRRSGAVPTGRMTPAIAFAGKNVQFLWSPLGFVIELIEQGGDARVFTPIT